MHVALVMLSEGASHQRYAAHAARELAERHRVDVVTNRFVRSDLFDGSFTHHRIRAPRTPKIEPATLHLANLMRAARLLRRLSPNVVHYTCPHPWNMALPLIGPDTKNVFTIHDVEPHPGESKAWALSIRIYNAVVSGLADRIVLHGTTHLKTVEEWGVDTEKFVVAPLGEYPAPPTPPPPSESRTILFFGRIRPYKGLGVLADAAQLLRNEGQDFRLVIAGAGDLDPYRSRLEAVGAEIHNQFIEPDDISALFSNCRCVVLPYLSATQSGVIPQAYAHRRPVIATRVGALPEAVIDQQTGILVAPENPHQLGEAIKTMLASPHFADKLGAYGFALFRKRFSPPVMACRFDQIYKTLRSSPHRPS